MKYRNAQSKKQKTVPQLAGEYERARLERDELTVQFQRMTEKEKLGPEGKANMRKNNRAQQDFRGPGRAPRRDRKRSGSLDDSAAPRVPAAGGGGPSPSPQALAMTLRALDICCGAGGLSRGLQLAGFDVFGVDDNRDAIETHRRHVGPCQWTDVRTWLPPSADLCAGGPPCQPFSTAGKRRGIEDPRYLVPDFLRIARMSGARAVLFENVRGLVRKPRDFRIVLAAFEAEWLVTWTVLDAAHYGVPQHRQRLFVVGFKDPEARARFRWPAPTHAPPGELFGASHRTVRQALGLGNGAHRKGPKDNARSGQLQGMRLLDVDAPAFTIGGHSFDLLDQPAPCVTATEQKSAMGGSQPMRRRRRASERLSEALGSLDRPSPAVRPNAYHDSPDPDRASRRPMAELTSALGMLDTPAPCITAGGTESGGGAEPLANRRQRERLGVELEAAGLADRPATTVQADPRLAIAGHHDRQQNGPVRLTVEQCALLQAFPAGWTWTGNKASQHRQIGNAVPPPLGEAMGRAVRAALLGK